MSSTELVHRHTASTACAYAYFFVFRRPACSKSEGSRLKPTLGRALLATLMSGLSSLSKGALLGDVRSTVEKSLFGCFDFSEEPIALTLR